MKRIFLILVTNLAVLALLSMVIFVIEQVFGVRLGQGGLGQGGLGGLLVFAAIFGFGGSLISLALLKWTAKRLMDIRVIVSPQSDVERWLVTTVKHLADQAHIGMPEVGVFDAEEMNAFATGARQGRLGGSKFRAAARHVAHTDRSRLGPGNQPCREW